LIFQPRFIRFEMFSKRLFPRALLIGMQRRMQLSSISASLRLKFRKTTLKIGWTGN